MSDERTVEIRLAYTWTCEDCGRDVFEHACVPELAPDEVEDARQALGIPDDEDAEGLLMISPTHVQCPDCGAEFATRDFRLGDDPCP